MTFFSKAPQDHERWFSCRTFCQTSRSKLYQPSTLVANVAALSDSLTVNRPSPEDRSKVDRAIELSRDKYCSVLHSLRPDIEFETTVEGV